MSAEMVGGIDLNEAFGETNEYANRVVFPESYYVGTLNIQEVGNQENEKQTPFAKVEFTIAEGPFAGQSIQDKLYLTPGAKGGGLGLFLGATKAITGQSANIPAIAAKYGIALPVYGGGDMKEFRQDLRRSFAEQFAMLDADKKLSSMLELFNVKQWDGKKIVVKVEIDQQEAKEPDPVTGIKKVFIKNQLRGFFGQGDTARGLGYVRSTAHKKQQEDREAMINAGQPVSA